jgi:hypothetical protein
MPNNPEREDWASYSKLVLRELEKLNDNYETMRKDFDLRFKEMNDVLIDFKNTVKTVDDQKLWIEKVNDVWSPAQMKEAKDEIYRQKNKWVATVAIITFLQVLLGIAIALWGKF